MPYFPPEVVGPPHLSSLYPPFFSARVRRITCGKMWPRRKKMELRSKRREMQYIHIAELSMSEPIGGLSAKYRVSKLTYGATGRSGPSGCAVFPRAGSRGIDVTRPCTSDLPKFRVAGSPNLNLAAICCARFKGELRYNRSGFSVRVRGLLNGKGYYPMQKIGG
jgi:hypothetical protein